MNILVVDDKQDILLLVKTILELENHSVITIDNGREAIKICEQNNFTLIFLDLMMEDMDGYATLKELRKGRNKDTYIIALTAKAYASDKEQVLEAGFNDHFSKPFRTAELIKKINSLKK